ncbi:unnamed protein product [Haemonchus placei]|uniref:FCH domain-containing protein n=1 Tax=Haemonchus placei TaxID=6290 RepID=A0A0N4VRX9_HAEPC|nr:unnamed protein product [Haemonchus placei]
MTPSGSERQFYTVLDQTDAVAGYTQKGVEFLERIGVFAKERALIEEEYAAKLRTLAKKSLGRKKEDEEAAKHFTYVRSFANLLHELELLAGQHELMKCLIGNNFAFPKAFKWRPLYIGRVWEYVHECRNQNCEMSFLSRFAQQKSICKSCQFKRWDRLQHRLRRLWFCLCQCVKI